MRRGHHFSRLLHIQTPSCPADNAARQLLCAPAHLTHTARPGPTAHRCLCPINHLRGSARHRHSTWRSHRTGCPGPGAVVPGHWRQASVGGCIRQVLLRTYRGCSRAHWRTDGSSNLAQPGEHNGCGRQTTWPSSRAASGVADQLTSHPHVVQACPPVLGLRNINPYVESPFEDWRQVHSLVASAPRVAMPLVRVPQCAGTSSFGMSGVNAHAVVESSLDICDRVLSSSTPMLQRQRHWALAPAFQLAGTALQFGPRCSFLVTVSRPALSFLHDHQVTCRLLASLLTCITVVCASEPMAAGSMP